MSRARKGMLNLAGFKYQCIIKFRVVHRQMWFPRQPACAQELPISESKPLKSLTTGAVWAAFAELWCMDHRWGGCCRLSRHTFALLSSARPRFRTGVSVWACWGDGRDRGWLPGCHCLHGGDWLLGMVHVSVPSFLQCVLSSQRLHNQRVPGPPSLPPVDKHSDYEGSSHLSATWQRVCLLT